MQQGAGQLGQRANPQMGDPMQNMNNRGLPNVKQQMDPRMARPAPPRTPSPVGAGRSWGGVSNPGGLNRGIQRPQAPPAMQNPAFRQAPPMDRQAMAARKAAMPQVPQNPLSSSVFLAQQPMNRLATAQQAPPFVGPQTNTPGK